MTRRKDSKIARKIAIFIRKTREKKFPGRGGKSAAAAAFGIAPSNWIGWETGKSVPDDVNQRKLAAFFGVSLAELRGDHEKPPAEAGDKNGINRLALLEEAHTAAGRMLKGAAATLSSIGRGEIDPELAALAFEAALDAFAATLRSPQAADTAPPASPVSHDQDTASSPSS